MMTDKVRPHHLPPDQSPNGHDRTRDTPRDRIPANKASSLQSHSKMGVLMRGCRSPGSDQVQARASPTLS